MIEKPIDELCFSDLGRLIENRVRECKTVEYKRELPGMKDSDKKEFLGDIASFANASGGYIFFGIDEERDDKGKPTGLPKDAVGVGKTNLDGEMRRLENLIRDGIAPRIWGVRLRAVESEDRAVLAAWIPQSLRPLHMVTIGGSQKFYSRNSAGKYRLDVEEIRSGFLRAHDLTERVRRFRDERLGRIIAGEGPLPTQQGPAVVLHVVPLAAFIESRDFSVGEIDAQRRLLPDGAFVSSRANLEGLLEGARHSHRYASRYVQYFRTGAIEFFQALNQDFFVDSTGNTLRSAVFEASVREELSKSFQFVKGLQLNAPLVVMMSLFGVKGLKLGVGPRQGLGRDLVPLDRDHLLLPETHVETFGRDIDAILKPVFDIVWNAFGFERCQNYDASGKWRPPQL